MKGYGSDKPINMRQTAEITLYNNKCIPMEICSRVPVFPQKRRLKLTEKPVSFFCFVDLVIWLVPQSNPIDFWLF